MQGVRQHIIFEFFEKLFATLAFGTSSVLSPLALFALAGRRTAWRQQTPEAERPKTLAYREVVLLFAIAAGAFLKPFLRNIPFDPLILSVLFLILTIGCLLLAERSSAALVPGFGPTEWKGPALRNLFGWILLGLGMSSFWRHVDSTWVLGCSLLAICFAFVSVGMAYRRGEPGLLIPGAFLTMLGVIFWNPWLTAAGLGWLIPTAVLITYNLKASFALRALLCGGAAWAGLYAPSWVPVAVFPVLFLMSLEMWRFEVRLAIYLPLRMIHKFKVYGLENCSAEGAGIVMSNHVSLADGWLLGAMTQRMCRFLVFDAYYNSPVSRFLLNLFRTIPISQGARRDAIESLRKARGVIEEGHFAGIFPEGGITRSGHLHVFQKGFTRIIAGTQIPVIPAYMNGLWTSSFSFSEQKVNLRLGRLFRPFEIEFGTPLPPTITAPGLWKVIKGLETNAAFRDAHRAPILPVAFLKSAQANENQIAVRAGKHSITYGELASSALLFARHLNHRLRRKSRVGIFLPDGVEKVIAHVAVGLSGHVGTELDAPGVGALITSQAWLDHNGISKSDNMIFIGRTLEKFDSRDQNRTWIYRKLSANLAWKQVCPHAMRKDSAAAIVSSPRGFVVLSHRGLWSAAWAARRVLWWKPGVTVRNQVPLSRATSLSLGFWMPLLNGATLVFGDQACDFEFVEKPGQEHPDSKHVLVLDPSEPLEDRYLPITELAEASGAVAIASPPVDFQGEVQTGHKPGTLGRLPFGLEIDETETGIKFRSPSRLLRYLDSQDATTQAHIDEWFAVELPITLNDQCFIEWRQTSSTPEPDQKSPGE